jgi:hypothetical protein
VARATLRRATAVLALALALGCGPTTAARVEALHERTARNGATATNVTEVERTVAGVRYAWDVQAPRSWEDYRADVIDTLKPGFSVVVNDATSLTLSQQLSGDVYRLEFRVTASTPITVIHVVLSAMAD